MIELLAPVGDQGALRAAIQNGADAVYLGGKSFSARQNAANFTLEELKEAIDYAHLYGVRVYAAVNTLIANSEFSELFDYIFALNNLNIDALIIQDLGAVRAIKAIFPEIPLHASTQMTIHNSWGVKFLKKMGFSRAVLAREVSLENIKLIKEETKLPLEVFVHGALCVSFSGQCLMSSMIGGRSGNRGRCAQPCRLPYSLLDSQGNAIESGHLLSPKDLKMIDYLPCFAEAGVKSLKIEGRMKRPEYVATVVRHYREALDSLSHSNFSVSSVAQNELQQIFNRDFTTGYYFKKPGPHLMGYQRPNNRGMRVGRVVSYDYQAKEVTIKLEQPLRLGDGFEIWVKKGGRIVGEIKKIAIQNEAVEEALVGEVTFPIYGGIPQVGDRVFKTLDIELLKRARDTFQTPGGLKKFPLSFSIELQLNKPVRLKVEDDQGNEVIIQGTYKIEKAQKHPLTKEVLAYQLGRLGNTSFYLNKLEINQTEGVIVPISELNFLRRQAIEELEKIRRNRLVFREKTSIETYSLRRKQLDNKFLKKDRNLKHSLAVSIGDFPSLKAALSSGAEIIYFGTRQLRKKRGIEPSRWQEVVQVCHAYKAQAVLALPYLVHEQHKKEIDKLWEAGLKAGVDGFLVANTGLLQQGKELGIKNIWADYPLNVFNDYAIQTLLDWDVRHVALSPELTLEQIKTFRQIGKIPLETLVHGRLPLMVIEHCAVGNILGTGHKLNGCPMPCQKDDYGLEDRLKMVFPLECDQDCRMWVFNSKTLCLVDHLQQIVDAGVNIFRIEGRREDQEWISKVVRIYREVLDQCLNKQRNLNRENIKEKLLELNPEGFTTGHYFRGVD